MESEPLSVQTPGVLYPARERVRLRVRTGLPPPPAPEPASSTMKETISTAMAINTQLTAMWAATLADEAGAESQPKTSPNGKETSTHFSLDSSVAGIALAGTEAAASGGENFFGSGSGQMAAGAGSPKVWRYASRVCR